MRTYNPLRTKDVRFHNQKIILSMIYQARDRGISQSELVESTGLRAPTLFRIFSSLEEMGLIEIFEDNDNYQSDLTKKGRRPTAYTTQKDALYTIGMEFWVSYISVGVFDFRGNKILSSVEPMPKDVDVLETVDRIVAMVGEMISCLGIPEEKILGMGVAAPGQVDTASRSIVGYGRIAGMSDFPLAEKLEGRLKIPVVLHNNSSAMALSEFRYGGYDHKGSMFVFLIRSGVGGSFVNRDGICTSERKTLEPGHVSISFDGPQCYCGIRGCLEAYLTELDAPYRKEGKADGLLFESLERMLEDEDPEAEKTVIKAADYMYAAMKSIVRLLSPKSFLILTGGKLLGDRMAGHIERRWQGENDVFLPGRPGIFGSTYTHQASQRGASDLVITHYFS